jgi:hypothetical protein
MGPPGFVVDNVKIDEWYSTYEIYSVRTLPALENDGAFESSERSSELVLRF